MAKIDLIGYQATQLMNEEELTRAYEDLAKQASTAGFDRTDTAMLMASAFNIGQAMYRLKMRNYDKYIRGIF